MRQPVISIPGWQTTKVWGEEIPLSFEAVFLAIAEKLELPGFGPDGFGKGVPYIRPGVVAFPFSFGHWSSGAQDVEIDGKVVKGDPRRAVPLMANGAMQLDPVMGNVTLSDLAGGSAVFYDSKVKVEKVG